MRKIQKRSWAIMLLVILITFVSVANASNTTRELQSVRQQAEQNDAAKQKMLNEAIDSRHKALETIKAKDAELEATKQREAAEKAEKERLQSELQAKLQRKAEQERLAALSRSNTTAVASAPARVNTNQPAQPVLAGCSNLRPLVAQYDWDINTMMRIMNAESGCDPINHNFADNHRSCMGSYGLFQIGCVHGVTAAEMADPVANISKAYNIWRQQGYTAWSTY